MYAAHSKMASHYSANQYENAYTAKRLQNYEIPLKHKKHPDARQGFTKVISDEHGHLLPGVKRSKECPWGNFKGTWDRSMDCRVTNHCKDIYGKTKIPNSKVKESQNKSETCQKNLETCTS